MEIRTPAADDAAGRLAEPAPLPAVPGDDECVLCYVDRMLDSHGCDHTLRWARRWRELRAPAGRGLERRLEARGGFCDCEVFLNGWSLREDLQLRDEDGELVWPSPRPPCSGVGRRSTQPCANWEPWRRPRW
jgi:Protein of unknown function (DUF2695)